MNATQKKNIRQEIIERIVTLTPEQFERLITHPDIVQMMTEENFKLPCSEETK